jgi:hypothetical protein
MDPPVSEPNDPSPIDSEMELAEPPLDPPAMHSVFHGFKAVP